MGNLRKWIIFVYLDVLTSITQLLVTVISSLLSIYFRLRDKKRIGKDNSVEFAPTFNLVLVILAAYATIGNILKGTKLLNAEKNVRSYSINTQG